MREDAVVGRSAAIRRRRRDASDVSTHVQIWMAPAASREGFHVGVCCGSGCLGVQPTAPPPAGDVTEFSMTSQESTCALRANGTVNGWGANNNGQLGDGTTTASSTPAKVLGLADATAISGWGGHSCALIGDGTVRCRGDNQWGPLGDGTTIDRNAPVEVYGLAGATGIAAMNNASCALVAGADLSRLVEAWWQGDGARSLAPEGSTTLAEAWRRWSNGSSLDIASRVRGVIVGEETEVVARIVR